MKAIYTNITSTINQLTRLNCLLNCAVSSVGGEYNDRTDGGFESAVKVSEALNIKHVNFINEKHTWY